MNINNDKIAESCPKCGGIQWEHDEDVSEKDCVIFKRYCVNCGYEEILGEETLEEMDREYEEDMREMEKDDV